ncbi:MULTISPECIES: spore germination protein [Heyndrickxia]|jgi:hypothetical protein|uniref:Uncharacterized protein n=1 Tax=Heyndrickxia oleronia TaxID=38875 RepID=A0A8E2IFH3_9BACI|nr:spore germination protein [Heyndrickxia oleronia]NYV68027.1 spore germination protein [Bacillus sp. Gen3]OJH19807.1 hypothetical protein BLX88_05930 [Bacillus obstructivus]MBU5212299.1 spore germination protein [Heyndrickxia oleronia]MCI1589377.1 spore germination protein [Heyndrickxia oleronia]MCI1612607.1 spore germination protein [Heyndrickxia oleronia]
MFFFTPTVVNMLGFKINSVDNSSVINAGPVQAIDQFTSYKRNQAFGEQNGDFSLMNLPLSSVVDPDISDSATAKNSFI